MFQSLWTMMSTPTDDPDANIEPVPVPVPVSKMFAILVVESEYPCGNIFGIFDTLEKAEEARKKLKDVTYVGPGTSYTQEDKDNTRIEIIEITPNMLYPSSLTGCAGCMTNVKISPLPTLEEVTLDKVHEIAASGKGYYVGGTNDTIDMKDHKQVVAGHVYYASTPNVWYDENLLLATHSARKNTRSISVCGSKPGFVYVACRF